MLWKACFIVNILNLTVFVDKDLLYLICLLDIRSLEAVRLASTDQESLPFIFPHEQQLSQRYYFCSSPPCIRPFKTECIIHVWNFRHSHGPG